MSIHKHHSFIPQNFYTLWNHMKSLLRIYLIILGIFYCHSSSALGTFIDFFAKELDQEQSFAKQVEKNIEELKKRRKEAQDAQNTAKTQLDNTQKSVATFKERAQRARQTDEFINLQI